MKTYKEKVASEQLLSHFVCVCVCVCVCLENPITVHGVTELNTAERLNNRVLLKH